jgi:predicted transcriptional regulator
VKNLITEIFGENCKRAKVFDLLLSHPHIEYSKSDIAESAKISRVTLDTFIDKLVEYGIIKATRKYRNSQLYQINMDSTITQALNSFQNQLADIEFEKEMIEHQKVDPEIKPVKPFEEIVKQEIITSHAAIKELYNRLGKTIEEFEEKVEELKSDQ